MSVGLLLPKVRGERKIARLDRRACIPTTAMFSLLYPLVPVSQIPEVVLSVLLSQLETASRQPAVVAPSLTLALRKG